MLVGLANQLLGAPPFGPIYALSSYKVFDIIRTSQRGWTICVVSLNNRVRPTGSLSHNFDKHTKVEDPIGNIVIATFKEGITLVETKFYGYII